MTTINDLIALDNQYCFKRVYIKRRLLTPVGGSYYEADWYDITEYVLSVSDITWNVDDVELNNFTQGGFSLTCKNDLFEFADESVTTSLFYGYLTRHLTKVKIVAGYIDSSSVEYDYTIGAGIIIADDIQTESNGTIYIPCIAPATIFDDQSASYINNSVSVVTTYDVAGTYSFTCPVGTTSVTVECWGAGGGGGYGNPLGTKTSDGGGGGAYSKSILSLTGGTAYDVVVGAGGASAGDFGMTGASGGDTTFNTTSVVAKGGHGKADGDILGGQSAAGTGDTKYSGGNGAEDILNVEHGAGGSSAGITSDGYGGGNANRAGSLVGYTPPGAGSGGGVGQGGMSPGGGAGGQSGGAASGADGKVKLTYSAEYPVADNYTKVFVDWYDNIAVSDVVQYLYDIQVNSEYVFHSILEGIINTPQDDISADLYNFTNMKCSTALTELAEISNSCYFIDGDFKLNFISKGAGAVSQFTFTYNDIFSVSEYNDGVKNVYNRIEWNNIDSVIYSQDTWVLGDHSSIDKYKIRIYDIDNIFVTDNDLRRQISDSLLALYKNPKKEITITTKFMPQLSLLDRVTFNYGGNFSTSPPALWGEAIWGDDFWTGNKGGIVFEGDMKIIKISYNVMNFSTQIKLREI